MVLDSVILIDALNGVPAAVRFIEKVGPSAAITPITRAEVLAGYEERSQGPVKALLDRLRWIDLDPAVSDLAARLRREHRFKLPDAFQAAAAVHHREKLATRNTKDFVPGRHRFVLVPYEP
jgi:hypothetical protein